jgi:hypothetical protein
MWPEQAFHNRIGSMSSKRRTSTVRWKFRSSGHDPRQIDLLAVLALVVFIVVIGHYFYSTEHPTAQTKSAFIEPSQTVRW